MPSPVKRSPVAPRRRRQRKGPCRTHRERAFQRYSLRSDFRLRFLSGSAMSNSSRSWSSSGLTARVFGLHALHALLRRRDERQRLLHGAGCFLGGSALVRHAFEQFLVLARLVGLHRPAHELRELGKALRCATDGCGGCLAPVKTITAAMLLADCRSRTPMCIGVRRKSPDLFSPDHMARICRIWALHLTGVSPRAICRRSVEARCMPLACGGVSGTFRDR
jgi:hypothetical protein